MPKISVIDPRSLCYLDGRRFRHARTPQSLKSHLKSGFILAQDIIHGSGDMTMVSLVYA